MPVHTAGDRPLVIYRLGSLGDTIVALPALHAIARAFPRARRVALTNFPVTSKAAPLETILGGSGLIDGAISYPVGTRSVRELLNLRSRLRSLDADTLVYLTAARGLLAAWRDVLFFKLCGFKRIIGAPLNADLQHCRVDARELQEPEASRLARCVSALGPIDLDDPANWDLRLTAAEQQAGQAVAAPLSGAPYLAINMGGKAWQKDWGESNWRALIAAIAARHPGWGLLVVGAQADSERARALGRTWPGTLVDACGRLGPRESAAAMQGAAAFVGHDSGPLHLAAACGVGCVGLFGNFNQPRKWHPLGPRHQIIHRMEGLDTITVPEVLDALARVLDQRSTTHG